MDLIHFSKEPLHTVRSVRQSDSSFRGAIGKPKGLWVSDEASGYGWRQWCTDEQHNLGGLERAYRIQLAPRASVLLLTDAASVESLAERFPAAVPDANSPDSALRGMFGRGGLFSVDWEAVARAWQGILITPYQGSCRLNDACQWYYGWDCASGCIWDARAVASVTPGELPPLEVSEDSEAG